MNEIFTADMMDKSPSLLSSRFLQDVHIHAASSAVSSLRPNGLNDLDVCLNTIEYVPAHPDRPGGFHLDAMAAPSAVDR